ncbi:MAG: hypothetical protein ACYS76_15630, partial [Planctomycetota bacterium]
TDYERQAIINYYYDNPLEGYRRLCYMMMDADIVAVSASGVYRVLTNAGLLWRWDRQRQIFNPLHYLPLLERKPHCLPFARPFEQLCLPGCFDVLQGRMESELEHGTRDFIRVLRLLEKYPLKQLMMAVEKALRHRLHAPEAIEQFLPDSCQWRQTTFKLGGREHLRLVKVSAASLADYTDLLEPEGGVA